MESSFIMTIMPDPLKRAMQQDEDAFMSELFHNAFLLMGEEAPEPTSKRMLVDSSTDALLSALKPVAQKLMVPMTPWERSEVMAWLSDPRPIAEALSPQIDKLLSDKFLAATTLEMVSIPLREAAGSIAELPAEMVDMLQKSSHPEGRDALVDELQRIGRPPSPETRREVRAEAAAVRAAAAACEAAAKEAVRFEGVAKEPRRSPRQRAALARRACPLEALGPDLAYACTAPLDAATLLRLKRVNKRWKQQAEATLRARPWQDAWGCIYPSTLLRVVTEADVSRLDLACARRRTPAASEGPPTQLRLRRLDGPSVGPVSSRHVLAVVAADGSGRLDIGGRSVYPQVTMREDPFTRFFIRRCDEPPAAEASPDGKSPASPSGARRPEPPKSPASSPPDESPAPPDEWPLQYEECVGIFSSPVDESSLLLNVRLSLGAESVYEPVSTDDDCWSTRLCARPIER